jgi:hypothetical protein
MKSTPRVGADVPYVLVMRFTDPPRGCRVAFPSALRVESSRELRHIVPHQTSRHHHFSDEGLFALHSDGAAGHGCRRRGTLIEPNAATGGAAG